MICEGFLAEDYGLYVIGIHESQETGQIREHLQSGCAVCRRNVRETEAAWYCFAYSQAQFEPLPIPPPLRQPRLSGQRAWFPVFPPIFEWKPGLAFAGGVLVTATALYFLHSVPRSVAPGLPSATEQALQQSQRETTYWKDRAQTAEESLHAHSAPPLVPAPITPAAPPRPQQSPLAAELAAAQSQAQTAADLLARERAHSAELQSQIDSQRALLAGAQQHLTDTEKRASALARDVASAAGRDTQLKTLADRVQQLERQNAAYRETLVHLEGQMQRSTQLIAFFASPSLQMAKLQGTEAGARTVGQAYVVDGQRVVFYASQLPALASGKCYQLWLIRGKNPAIVSGGVFKPDAQHGSSVEINNPSLSTGIRGVAVTEEPDGGSPGPTGHKIMAGTLRASGF